MLDTRQIIDQSNNPSLVEFQYIIDFTTNKTEIRWLPLPPDVIIIIDGEKIIAESQILDGVMLFERVSRKPFDIDFNFTIRNNIDKSPSNSSFQNIINNVQYNLTNNTGTKFPQDAINDYISILWNPNEVVKVRNTLLNGIGINELIIKKITITPIRGSTSVSGTIKCLENCHDNKGGTLVIT
jgi:hypothetical protein